MTHNFFFKVFFLLSPVLLFAQGAKGLVKIEKKLDLFYAIESSAPIDIELVQSGASTLSLETDKATLERVVYTIENGVLKITLKEQKSLWKKNNYDTDEKIYAILSTDHIKKINIDGAGLLQTRTPWLQSDPMDITMNGAGELKVQLQAPELTIHLNGSADANLDIEVQRLFVHINGSGDCELRGKAPKANLSINGSGGVSATNLTTQYTDLALNGSGKVHLLVTRLLSGFSNGSSTINVFGKPKTEIKVSGSSKLNAL